MKKQILTHIGIVALLLAVACVYLSPALGGKVIRQGDVEHFEAMAYSQKAEKKESGKVPHWNSAMFSGMPGYQITNDPPKQVFHQATSVLTLRHLGLDRNIGIIFLYLLGFYVALLAFGVSPWIALAGAIGFGLGSYNIIIIQAGHITKAWAMAMMAPVLAGMFLTLSSAVATDLERSTRRRRVLWGSLLFTLSLILQISFNHIQITFYTAIGCVAMGLAYLVVAIRNRRIGPFAMKVGILVVGAALAFGCNLRLLLVNEEYAKYTMRGGSELTVTPADLYGGERQTVQNSTSSGLDIDYAFRWSYGIGETYTLLVPGAMGGSNTEKVGHDSHFYSTFRSETAPLYWGSQPFTSGPVYFGAIVVFLFLLGLVVVRKPERWWLLATSIVAILLSWGGNLMGLNEWVFNHVPLYNKFRTPSMALVLANVCMALLAALALAEILKSEHTDADRKRINKGIYCAAGALGGLILVVLIASGGFDYTGSSDRQMEAQYGNQWPRIFDVLVDDRAALLRSDSWRSLIFIALAAALLWLYNNDKLKLKAIPIAGIGLLMLIDLWGVDRRYLNESNFVEARKTQLRKAAYDNDIDQQAARYGDHDFRVFNLATDPFNDATPAAFHNQVGGYSAAKLNRYQDIISFYLAQGNMNVLNMLNTRYFVQRTADGSAQVMRNPEALGNAWFVDSIRTVGSPDEEILALATIDPAHTAVVDTSLWKVGGGELTADSAAWIRLVPNKPKNSDYLKYEYNSNGDAWVVMSEVHYAPDWRAYIDGKPAEYVRANYILRAMRVPAGSHTIEFKNEAPRFNRLDNAGLAVSIVALLAMCGAMVIVLRRGKRG